MELVVLYNTERFTKHDPSRDPVTRDSVVKVYDFVPAKRYVLQTKVMRGTIDENRGLYETNSIDFFDHKVPDVLLESTKTSQTAYVSGSVGLTSDRLHIERTHYVLADLMAYGGGLILASYLIMYIVIFLY